jgi:hypothetical protein
MQGATLWPYRACVAECDLWRDLGARCKWIRCVHWLQVVCWCASDAVYRVEHDGSSRSRLGKDGVNVIDKQCLLVNMQFCLFLARAERYLISCLHACILWLWREREG